MPRPGVGDSKLKQARVRPISVKRSPVVRGLFYLVCSKNSRGCTFTDSCTGCSLHRDLAVDGSSADRKLGGLNFPLACGIKGSLAGLLQRTRCRAGRVRLPAVDHVEMQVRKRPQQVFRCLAVPDADFRSDKTIAAARPQGIDN